MISITFSVPDDDPRAQRLLQLLGAGIPGPVYNGPAEGEAEAEEEHPVVAAKRRRSKKAKAEVIDTDDDVEESSENGLDLDELKTQLKQTIDAVGIDSARGVLERFKVAKLSELPAKKYAAFSAALTQARSVAE